MSFFTSYICSSHLRRKVSLWAMLTLCSPATTAMPPELFYGFIVSDEQYNEYPLAVSSLASWGVLKQAMEERNEITTLENQFTFGAYNWLRIPTLKKKKVDPAEMDQPLCDILSDKQPLGKDSDYFDTARYEDIVRNNKFTFAACVEPKISQIAESEQAGRSIFARDESGTFVLMSIDNYYTIRQKKLPCQRQRLRALEKERQGGDPTNIEEEDDDMSILKKKSPFSSSLYMLIFAIGCYCKPSVQPIDATKKKKRKTKEKKKKAKKKAAPARKKHT